MPYEVVTISRYGKAVRPLAVLVVSHDGDGTSFLEAFPELMSVVPASREVFGRYLALERDVGSAGLAHRVATRLMREEDVVHRVDVVEVNLPRGIIDGNRVSERAVRNVFDHAAHPMIVTALQELHHRAIQAVRAVLENLELDGLFIDVHTMAPYSPDCNSQSSTEAVGETPTTLEDYIDAYTNRARWGERRYLDLVTCTDRDPTVLAYPPLLDAFTERLGAADIVFRLNHPYPTSAHVLSTRYLERYRGLVIDVPKDYLVAQRAEEGGFDLLNVKPDPQAVARLAAPLADALQACLL